MEKQVWFVRLTGKIIYGRKRKFHLIHEKIAQLDKTNDEIPDLVAYVDQATKFLYDKYSPKEIQYLRLALHDVRLSDDGFTIEPLYPVKSISIG